MTAPPDSHASVEGTLDALTRPRLAGSASEAELRAFVARTLGELGCSVREEPFAYDPFWVRRGFGYVLGGAALALTLAALGPQPFVWALIALLLVAPVIVVAGTGRPRVDRRPRLRTANLVATLPGAEAGSGAAPEAPHVVLMAHLDSKSQNVSFVARSACAALALSGLLLGGLVLALSAPAGRLLLAMSAAATGVLAIGGSGNLSPGALDNATGVAAVIELVRRLRPDARAGLRVQAVITTAEEDGLVGAHRFAERHAHALRGSLVINVDTIGPGERMFLVAHERRVAPTSVLGRARVAFERAASTAGVRLVRRRVPFPAGVDSHPLAREGVPALSIAAGGVRNTFRHLHRPSDTLARVDVAAVVRAVDVIAQAVRALNDERGRGS